MDAAIRCGQGFGSRGHGKAAKKAGQAGFTAIELMVALTLVALLLALSVPGFAALRREAGLSVAANELLSALHLARSSAALSGQPVTVCLSSDEQSCVMASQSPASGWLVFRSAGQAFAQQPAAGGAVLQSYQVPSGITLSATRPAVTFWPVSRSGSTSTFELCDVEGRSPGRAVVVSQTGRARVSAEGAACRG